MFKRFAFTLMMSLGIWKSSAAEKVNAPLLTTILCEGVPIAELTEQEKRALFLKVRQDLIPVAQSTPTGSPHPPVQQKKESPPIPQKSVTPSNLSQTKRPIEKALVQKKDRAPPSPIPAVIPQKIAPAATAETNKEIAKVSPFPQMQVSDSKQQDAPATLSTAPIRVVKSGYQKDKGWILPSSANNGGPSQSKRYRYLTISVRRAIDRVAVRRSRWKYVIIHNSGTRQGNARVFDTYHRRVRRMQNGLAYHFVIGNGHSSGNGQIEVGHRWHRQINGGHMGSDYLNNIAVGICLVGDYNRDAPTPQQIAALEELTAYLRQRVGRFKGRLAIVLGHREINPKPTDCPGKKFPLRWLRRKFR